MVFINERFDSSQHMDDSVPIDDDEMSCKAVVDKISSDLVYPKIGKRFDYDVHASKECQHITFFIMSLACY